MSDNTTNLKVKLTEDMKQAMRAHDADKLGVIRFILSLIKNVEIDHGVQDDPGIVKIISGEIKRTKDALNDFQKAGRQDLVTQETAKIAVMESYLPAQLTDAELKVIVDQVKAESNETHPGKLTGLVMARVAGKADGARVAQLINS